MASEYDYIDSGITDPYLLSQLGKGMNLTPWLQPIDPLKSVGGWSDLYHGTTYGPEIMKGGFTTPKVFASPDYTEAEKYAKKGSLSGTKYGEVTGDVLKTKVRTNQLQNLLSKGLTGGREVVLTPEEATRIFQQGSGDIRGTTSWMSKLGRYGLPYLRSAGKFLNRFPQAAAVSDMLFGTDITASSVKDINKLLGVKTKEEVTAAEELAATKTETSKKEAITGGAAGASEPSQTKERPKRQKGTQKQEQKRQQRTRSRGAQRSSSKRRSSRSSKPTHHFSQGGLVSIDYLTRRL